MKRHRLKTCPCLSSQLHTNVFGNLVVAQQTFAEVREAPLFCREDTGKELVPGIEARTVTRRSSLSALRSDASSLRRQFKRALSEEVIREHPDEATTWGDREERGAARWLSMTTLGRDPEVTRPRASADVGSSRREFKRTLSDEVIREHPEEATTWSAREERKFQERLSGRKEEEVVVLSPRRLSDEVIDEEDVAEEDVWSARVERVLRRGRKDTYHGAQLSRGSSLEEEVGRRKSTTELEDGGRRRRVSELVDRLLLDIYGRCGRRVSAGGSSAAESDGYSASATSSWCWRTEGYRPGQDGAQRASVSTKSLTEMRAMVATLRLDVQMAGGRLVRQLKRRDRLKARQAIQNSVVTAYLQAVSEKRSEDTKMRFSVVPYPGDSGFNQWHDAMKMVARLPGGIPPEFRRRLWLTLAERHLQERGVDWSKMQRFCFNEWTNPDDDELGVQIVKDLHRTGCSLFCGAAAEENQALLKRVLLAYARWNKAVGYCQGFNMLAALILQVMDRSESDAVKVMIHLIEGVLPESYFANNLRGLSVDMAVFRDLLRLRLPALSRHLELLQHEAGDSATGTSYEPPLTNVFTMQWFLTLFSNCLPQATVLRVWDLIFLEGNEVLLRTALAIWDGLADRIMAVESADEFYSIMGVLTREMLEFGLMDANHLIKTIVTIAPFPFPELPDLRDKYLYNITPWTQTVSTAARRGLRLFYSDDDEDTDEDDEKIAIATAYGISTVFRSPRRRDSVNRAPSPTTSLSTLGYSSAAPDRDRLALDISALKQQYAKLRERQRQAHIILTAACSRQSMGPSAPTPVAMNHLLLGKSALLNVRGRRMGPLPGAVPPLRSAPQGRLLAATSKTPHAERKSTSGETLHWKDTARRQQKKAADDSSTEVPLKGAMDMNEQEALETRENGSAHDSSDDKSSSSSSSSSSSTELCDEPDRLSDFDSEEPTSISDASSYIPPSDNLLKIPSPSTDVSSSPSPDPWPSTDAFRNHPSQTDNDAGRKYTKRDNHINIVDTDDASVPDKAVIRDIPAVTFPKLNLSLHQTTDSVMSSKVDLSSPTVSEQEKHTSPLSATLDDVYNKMEGIQIPKVSIEDADVQQGVRGCEDDGKTDSVHEKPGETEKLYHIYYKSTQGLTNIMNEISNCSQVDGIPLVGEHNSEGKHYFERNFNSNSPTSPFSHKYYCKQLISTSPSEGTDCIQGSRINYLHSESNGEQIFTAVNNFLNDNQEISNDSDARPSINTSQHLKDSVNFSPQKSNITNENKVCMSEPSRSYENQESDQLHITHETAGVKIIHRSAIDDEEESNIDDVPSATDSDNKTHVPVTVIIQSESVENLKEISKGMEECSLSNVGRRKSERALKIIQENFEILQRITQCHGRHSDRQLEAKTDNCDDMPDDMKLASSYHSVDGLHSEPTEDKMLPNTSLQTDLSTSATGESDIDTAFAESHAHMVSQSDKFEILNSSIGIKDHTQQYVGVLECDDTNKSEPQGKFVFENIRSENKEKANVLLECKNYEDTQDHAYLKPKTLSTITMQNGAELDTLDRQTARNKIQDDTELDSKYINFSRKSAKILEDEHSNIQNLNDCHTLSTRKDTVPSSNTTTAEYGKNFYSDYFMTSNAEMDEKPQISYNFKRLDDKHRSTINTFDLNDKDALQTFNIPDFKKANSASVHREIQEDDIFKNPTSLTSTERLTENVEQCFSVNDTRSTPNASTKNTHPNSYNFLAKDDASEKMQQDLGNDNSLSKFGDYAFYPRSKYSSECYQSEFTLQDQKPHSKRWSTGALCSDEATELYSERADRPNTEATETSERLSSSPETVTRKSHLSLALGVNESSRVLPNSEVSSELPLSSESSPHTVSSKTMRDCSYSVSAYNINSESPFNFGNRSTDSVSPPAAHSTQKMNIKLFPHNSRSSQLKSPPCSPVLDNNILSSPTSIRSTVLGSPTRNCKKYDPFPPRASLRQPKEIGIKLGLYSATSEADRKNSSKKP